MNMDKWIEENSTAIEDRGTCSVSYFVSEDKFRELLKTHAVVPRLLTDDQGEAIFDAAHDTNGDIRVMHKVMIEVAESE